MYGGTKGNLGACVVVEVLTSGLPGLSGGPPGGPFGGAPNEFSGLRFIPGTVIGLPSASTFFFGPRLVP